MRSMGNYGRVALGHLDSLGWCDLVIIAVTHVSQGWQGLVYVVELSGLGDADQLELVPVHFVITLCVGIDQTLLVLGETLQSCQLDLHVRGVVGELDVHLHKSDVVGSEYTTVMSPVQVVEVRVMRGAAKVAHLLTTGIKGADLPVHVGVDTAVEGSESRDIWVALSIRRAK
jgi:hypothetical protein